MLHLNFPISVSSQVNEMPREIGIDKPSLHVNHRSLLLNSDPCTSTSCSLTSLSSPKSSWDHASCTTYLKEQDYSSNRARIGSCHGIEPKHATPALEAKRHDDIGHKKSLPEVISKHAPDILCRGTVLETERSEKQKRSVSQNRLVSDVIAITKQPYMLSDDESNPVDRQGVQIDNVVEKNNHRINDASQEWVSDLNYNNDMSPFLIFREAFADKMLQATPSEDSTNQQGHVVSLCTTDCPQHRIVPITKGLFVQRHIRHDIGYRPVKALSGDKRIMGKLSLVCCEDCSTHYYCCLKSNHPLQLSSSLPLSAQSLYLSSFVLKFHSDLSHSDITSSEIPCILCDNDQVDGQSSKLSGQLNILVKTPDSTTHSPYHNDVSDTTSQKQTKRRAFNECGSYSQTAFMSKFTILQMLYNAYDVTLFFLCHFINTTTRMLFQNYFIQHKPNTAIPSSHSMKYCDNDSSNQTSRKGRIQTSYHKIASIPKTLYIFLVMMSLNVCFVSSSSAWSSSSSSSQLPADIKLGVLVAESCNETFLEDLRGLLDRVLQDFNSNVVETTLPSVKFKVTATIFPQCSTSTVVTDLNTIFSDDTVDAILSLATYDVHSLLLPLSTFYGKDYFIVNTNLPTSWYGHTFSPFLSFGQQASMLANILDFFSWQDVFIAYTDTSFWFDFASSVHVELSSRRFNAVSNSPLSSPVTDIAAKGNMQLAESYKGENIVGIDLSYLFL